MSSESLKNTFWHFEVGEQCRGLDVDIAIHLLNIKGSSKSGQQSVHSIQIAAFSLDALRTLVQTAVPKPSKYIRLSMRNSV